jgi:hypothetical protein
MRQETLYDFRSEQDRHDKLTTAFAIFRQPPLLVYLSEKPIIVEFE